MLTVNKAKLALDAFQILSCEHKSLLGRLFSAAPLRGLEQFFDFGQDMLNIIRAMSEMRHSWSAFLEICECIVARYHSALRIFNVQIAGPDTKKEVNRMLERVFGEDIVVNFTIYNHIQWGFIIYAHHLGLLYEHSDRLIRKSVENQLQQILGDCYA